MSAPVNCKLTNFTFIFGVSTGQQTLGQVPCDWMHTVVGCVDRVHCLLTVHIEQYTTPYTTLLRHGITIRMLKLILIALNLHRSKQQHTRYHSTVADTYLNVLAGPCNACQAADS